MSQQTIVALVLLVLILGVSGFVYSSYQKDAAGNDEITSFAECVEAGNPILESYPRQCKANGLTFVEFTAEEPPIGGGNDTYLSDNHALRNVIFVEHVLETTPMTLVESPLVIKGEAKGWYFEASFPIQVQDANGKVLGTGVAQAQGDWMTSDYVPFEATINYTAPATQTSGKIVFMKDNPSGLPENDESIEVPVTIMPKS